VGRIRTIDAFETSFVEVYLDSLDHADAGALSDSRGEGPTTSPQLVTIGSSVIDDPWDESPFCSSTDCP